MNQVPLSQPPVTTSTGAQQFDVALLSTGSTRTWAAQKRETRTIRRLVRHRATRQYLKDGGWTTDPLQASVFADSLDAVQACLRHGLTDVELALRIGTGTCDLFSTPLR
jgi:hypothetical protein